MERLFINLLLMLAITGSVAVSHASTTFLSRFKNNIRVAIDETPEKLNASVDYSRIEEKTNACSRSGSRLAIMSAATFHLHTLPRLPLRSFEASSDSAASFLENRSVIDKIDNIDEKMRSGEVSVQPWSGDYWPIRSGGIARRYLDSNFPDLTTRDSWLDAFNYFQANAPDKTEDKFLAPSEKYDLLVDDKNFSLTKANWAEGKQYNDRYGEVEKWMGYCHGWAPASFMEPRPTHKITVKSHAADSDKEIEFLPDDVKALASLKWANGINVTEDYLTGATRFLGNRCDDKEPKKDQETGRIIEPGCFDLNPGTWHIVVTNQIARANRPLIIDASFDYEVWNQPVTGYSFSYFNPKTLKPTEDLAEATIDINDTEFVDKFKKFRNNPNAVQLVGVKMYVEYVVETSPRNRAEDSPARDSHQTAVYHYDLELDSRGRIIGGEWYQNKHPDFIWMPLKNSISINHEDTYVKNDKDIVRVAPYASRAMIPLRRVIDNILANFR
ncbi:MAG: hypothetical protein A2Z20_08705 [Bdellovibrionales bacterium RBG_16_40_8]|nr:MAG: hypothetical protein A2Z20_08705 [Bdellovibrionales bacterium RBG_16_40_8]